jgi:hypothetical protein
MTDVEYEEICTKVENIINKIGISIYKNTETKEKRSWEDVFNDIARSWDKLDDTAENKIYEM